VLSNEVLTFGGLPVSNALHWDSSTHKALGSIVYKIISGLPKLRFEGWNDYFHMKRHFVLEEWDNYIGQLESHRQNLGHRSIADIIEEIGKEVVKYNKPQQHVKESSVASIPVNTTTMQYTKPSVTVTCEQLSLF